jgi:UDP-2,4-diacetamido-2,4,6-trideoxy-beta-L-altropyranose hydrolase
MLIFFRVDANNKLGSGHLMRCLTLADELIKFNATVYFICKKNTDNFTAFIESKGISVYELDESANFEEIDAQQTIDIVSTFEKKPNWLIIDHYSLSIKFESLLRPSVSKIMVLDDLANRKHDCDLLLDQNIFSVNRYEQFTPQRCEKLIGPQYTLLRNEFLTKRAKITRNFVDCKNILINFGGGDDRGLIEKSIKAIFSMNLPSVVCTVILGQANPNRLSLNRFLSKYPNVIVYEYVNNIADFMVEADLAIGSGGSSIWERCCLGLPSIVTAVSDIEAQLAPLCEQQKFLTYIGRCENVTVEIIITNIKCFFDEPAKLLTMSKLGMRLVDGHGCARVVQKIQGLNND